MKNKKESDRKYKLEKNIALFEISLFLISILSFSFIYSGERVDTDLIKKSIKFADLIPSVSAQSVGNFNLEETINNFNSIVDGIESGQIGCCFDIEEGLCSPNSARQLCESEENGKFLTDSSCNVNECSVGCCVLGSESQLVTETRCIKLSESSGLPMNYNPGINDALACVGLANSQNYGACLYGELDIDDKSNCKFTTKEDCNSQIGGNFFEDSLCSNPELNSVCERQKTTGCYEGKDEIYWYDSCGNRENIYDSNKDRSWNNGKILTKENSCGANSDNIKSSTCGNCDYNEGSICGKFRSGIDKKKKDGDYTCRDLNCRDGFRVRQNGDSWCLYDGQVGNGRDVVGSRHFRQLCVNGELKTEPCADYRKEICVKEGGIGESIKDTTNELFAQFGFSMPDLSSIPGLSGLGGGILGNGLGLSPEENISNNSNLEEAGSEIDVGNDLFDNNSESIGERVNQLTSSKALCRANLWEDCSTRNILTCSQNPDCKTKIVYVDTQFWFGKCVPQYPPGIDIGDNSILTNAVSGVTSSSLGSFSDYSNYLGGFGSGSGNAGGILGGSGGDICSEASKTCIVTYKKQCPSGKWECEENCECEKMLFTLQMNDVCTMLGDCGAKANIAGKVSNQGYSLSKKGKHGSKPPRLIGVNQIYAVFAKAGNLQGISGGVNGGFYNEVPGLDLTSLFGISVFNGGNDFGLTGGNDFGVYGGSSGGDSSGSVIGGVGGGLIGFSGIAGIAAGPVGLIVGGLVGYFGFGALCEEEEEEVEISFTCSQWVPPAVGNCEFCNNDPDKPCSKYRCESLGQNCKLINENTGQDECVTVDNTFGTPKITPFYEVLNQSFKYDSVSNNGFKVRQEDGECIKAFTPIIFGVKTNIPSVCRIGEERGNFSDLSYEFLEGNIYTENHTTTTYLPSIESIIASETSNSEEFSQVVGNETIYNYVLDQVGNINLYVRCTSVEGQENPVDYQINFCVRPGPDLTSPVVVASAPANNAVIRYNATIQQSMFFINEPAECKWSKENVGYFEMQNTLECEKDVDGGTFFGYPCVGNLTIESNDNKYYISCRDQPWLEENTSRNIGNNFEYSLKKSLSGLSISNLQPSGIIVRGSEPTSIDLTLSTLGGSENGKSVCQYSMNNKNYITFKNTLSSSHSQTFTSLLRGNYNFKVRCIDSAGNTAGGETNFTLDLDTQSPQITRVYYESGNLAIFTDEDSICYYKENSPACGFLMNSENVTKISEFSGTSHNLEWDEKTVYSVKCEDIWGNKPGGCSIIVKPETILKSG